MPHRQLRRDRNVFRYIDPPDTGRFLGQRRFQLVKGGDPFHAVSHKLDIGVFTQRILFVPVFIPVLQVVGVCTHLAGVVGKMRIGKLLDRNAALSALGRQVKGVSRNAGRIPELLGFDPVALRTGALCRQNAVYLNRSVGHDAGLSADRRYRGGFAQKNVGPVIGISVRRLHAVCAAFCGQRADPHFAVAGAGIPPAVVKNTGKTHGLSVCKDRRTVLRRCSDCAVAHQIDVQRDLAFDGGAAAVVGQMEVLHPQGIPLPGLGAVQGTSAVVITAGHLLYRPVPAGLGQKIGIY